MSSSTLLTTNSKIIPIDDTINCNGLTGPTTIETSNKSESVSSIQGTSSIGAVLSNFLNSLVGSGILSIPFVYAQCGVFGGIILMLIFAILCTYTLNLMIQTAQKLNVTHYESLGLKSLGLIGYIICSLCLLLLDLGACISFLIILGDCVFQLIQIWGYHSLIHRQLSIVIISIIIIFPPCLFRDISFYEKFSIIKMFSIGLVIIVVIYEWISYRFLMQHGNQFAHKFLPEMDDITWFNINGMTTAIGIIAYCFVCHDTAFIYYNTLYNPTTSRWSILSFLSITSAMLMSLIMSIPAYFTFGDDVQGNILNNYNTKNTIIIFTRCVYVITAALTYPTCFFVARHVLYALCIRSNSLFKIYLFKKQKPTIMRLSEYSQFLYDTEYTVKSSPLFHHLLVTILIFFVTLFVALIVDDLGAAMSIIGNVSSVNLAFVLPCIFHIKSSTYGFTSCCREQTIKNKFKAALTIYPPTFLILIGLAIATHGVMSQFQ
eukprot:196756_1